MREKAILDEKEAAYTGYCEGLNKGLEDGRKKGLQEGKSEGRKEGRKEGIKEGIKEGVRTTARNMKKEGIDIETIMNVTSLSKEEIEEL